MSPPQKAMLFAAGLGTRLRPLTLTTPKPLIEVGDKPLIVHALEALVKANVREVIINTHHLGEQIEQALGDGKKWNLKLHYSHEPLLLGTGGGLLNAKAFFENEKSFWSLNSDTLLEADLSELWARHLASQCASSVVVHTKQPPQFGGVWINSKTNRVASFLKSPCDASANASLQEVDFCGVSILSPAVFPHLKKAIKENPAPCLLRDGLIPLLQKGCAIGALPVSGYFNDVGTPKRLEEARFTMQN